MRERRLDLPLLVAFLVSLLLHAGAVVGYLSLSPTWAATPASNRDDRIADPIHLVERDDEVQLGIDDGTPSTMTWIGYRDFEEHLARLAEVEQAAFKDSPSGGAGGQAPGQPSPNAPPPSPAEPAPPLPEPAPPTKVPETKAPVPPPLQPLVTDTPEKPADPVPPAVKEPADAVPNPPTVKPLKPEQPKDPPPTPAEAPPKPQPEAPPKPEPPKKPQPQPTPPVPAAKPGDAPPGPPAPQEPQTGDQSDRESDPTSIIDVPPENWRTGKPLAAEGIEIKTRRPVLTELTRLTSAPRNPIVEIRFDRTGIPRQTRILQSSGDSRIDGPIMDCLYRWRASGKKLQALPEGELFTLRMKILLIEE